MNIKAEGLSKLAHFVNIVSYLVVLKVSLLVYIFLKRDRGHVTDIYAFAINLKIFI